MVDDSRFMTVLSFKLMDWPNDLLVYYRKAGEPWPEELMIEVEKLVKEWPTKFINLRKQAKKRQVLIFLYAFIIIIVYLLFQTYIS